MEPLKPETHHGRVDYVELVVTDLPAAKKFYADVFGWKFTDFGPGYATFDDGGIGGGLSVPSEETAGPPGGGGPLVIFFTADLAATEARVRSAGGAVVKPTFSFPGGRRFHFRDPAGNVLAAWSDRPGAEA